MSNNKKINLAFNLVLLGYVCLNEFLVGLFEPESEKAPLDAIYEIYPEATIAGAIIVAICLLMAGAQIIRIFWDRFISDMFRLRFITYQESLSIALMFMAFSPWRKTGNGRAVRICSRSRLPRSSLRGCWRKPPFEGVVLQPRYALKEVGHGCN